MIRSLFNGLILVLLLLSTSLDAKTLYLRDPLTLLFDSSLKNGLILGRPGFEANGLIKNASLHSSAYSAHLSFPVYYQKAQFREAGWTLALSGGRSPTLVTPNLLQIGASFWEASFGRATYGQFGGQTEGFLGYFALSFRNERTLRGNEYSRLVSKLGSHLPKHTYTLTLRMGAAQHPFGKGLIRQKISSLYTRVLGDFSFQFPSRLPRLKIKTELFSRLIGRHFFIGLAGQWSHFIGKETGFNVFEIQHSYHFGPTLQFISEHISFESFLQWHYYYQNKADYFESTPRLHLSLNVGI